MDRVTVSPRAWCAGQAAFLHGDAVGRPTNSASARAFVREAETDLGQALEGGGRPSTD